MTTSKQPVALVTGASSGIGRQVAQGLAERGWVVIAGGRDPERLDELAAATPGIRTLLFDLDSPDSIAVAASAVDEMTDGRGVDVLVNCAGFGVTGALSQVTDAALRRQFETNVFGLMSLTRALIPAMRRRRSGRIVNVSSLAGRFVLPFSGAYNASKYALEALSDALRLELQPFGIDVVVVEPGAVRTGFSRTSLAAALDATAPDDPYSAVIADAERVAQRFESGAVPVERVARAVIDAATRRRPRVRSVVPASGRLVVAAMTILPTRATDALLRRVSGLTRLDVTTSDAVPMR